MNKQTIILLILFLLGSFLRFNYLDNKPLWIDEVSFVNEASKPDIWNREIIPAMIQYTFHFNNEFWIRFPFALAGSLTILAMYLAIKDKNIALIACTIIAVHPLFVFWSTLARPYSFAGLFVVLSWIDKIRFPMMSIGLMTTPVAIFGLKIKKPKDIVGYIEYATFIILLIGGFLLRQDVKKDSLGIFYSGWLGKDFLIHARRIYYIPIIGIILYTFTYLLPALRYKNARSKGR